MILAQVLGSNPESGHSLSDKEKEQIWVEGMSSGKTFMTAGIRGPVDKYRVKFLGFKADSKSGSSESRDVMAGSPEDAQQRVAEKVLEHGHPLYGPVRITIIKVSKLRADPMVSMMVMKRLWLKIWGSFLTTKRAGTLNDFAWQMADWDQDMTGNAFVLRANDLWGRAHVRAINALSVRIVYKSLRPTIRGKLWKIRGDFKQEAWQRFRKI